MAHVVGEPLMTDNTVAPGTSYTYTIAAEDFHGNVGPAATISVTTPLANQGGSAEDGTLCECWSYWGGGGEQIGG